VGRAIPALGAGKGGVIELWFCGGSQA